MTNTRIDRFARPVAAAICVGAMLFTMWKLSSFVWAFFDGALMDERMDPFAEASISLHADVLTTALLLIFAMLFTKTLNAFWFALPVIGAFVLGAYDFQDFVVHPFLVDIGIYDLILGNRQSGTTPQVTRSLFLGLSTLALLALCMFRKTRSRDRIFVLLIAGVVIVTTFIFHLALPMGTLRFENERVAAMMVKEARFFPLDEFCGPRTCLFMDKDFNEVVGKRFEAVPIPPQEFITGSAAAVTDYGYSTKYVRSTSFNGTTFAIDGCVPRADSRPPATDYMCFSDAHQLDGLGRTTAAWMGFLSTTAHSTWLFGGVFLLWLHKRRFRIFRPRG